MPVKEIEVVSGSKKTQEIENRGIDDMKTYTDSGKIATVGNTDTIVTHNIGKHDTVLICDSESSDSCMPSEALAEVSVDMESDLHDIHTPHIEADTVILGDTNSDGLVDDTTRQGDVRSTDGMDRSDQTSNVTEDTSSNTATTDKRTNLRPTGKVSKKEKPTPVRKKEGETQVGSKS